MFGIGAPAGKSLLDNLLLYIFSDWVLRRTGYTNQAITFLRGSWVSIDKELLDILACPEDKSPVSLAGRELIEKVNNLIEKGELCNRGGTRVEKPVDGGLVREDGAYLYPIEDNIPIMLIEEAIPLSKIR